MGCCYIITVKDFGMKFNVQNFVLHVSWVSNIVFFVVVILWKESIYFRKKGHEGFNIT